MLKNVFVSIKPLHVSVFFSQPTTKHSGGPPEDGREKRPKHVGVLYLQTRF
jgi:hypothetical protein